MRQTSNGNHKIGMETYRAHPMYSLVRHPFSILHVGDIPSTIDEQDISWADITMHPSSPVNEIKCYQIFSEYEWAQDRLGMTYQTLHPLEPHPLHRRVLSASHNRISKEQTRPFSGRNAVHPVAYDYKYMYVLCVYWPGNVAFGMIV